MFSKSKGFIQPVIVLLLLLGVAVGAYLVQRPTSLRSKATLDRTRIEVFGPSVAGDRATSRNIRVRLVYVPSLPSPSPTLVPSSEPSPPIGCRYEEVVCVTDPCPRQLICPSSVPQPSCPPAPACRGRLIHGDPREGQCPSYFCIEPTPNPRVDTPDCKTGVNSFSVEGSCANGFTTVTYDCYDGFSNIEQAPNGCASSEALQEIAGRACENRSSCNPYIKQTNVKGIVYAQAVYPTHYRIANSLAELERAEQQTFSQNSIELDWVLTEGNGPKTIYAQFKVNGTWDQPVSTTITLNIQTPTPSSTPVTSPTLSPTSSPTGTNINPICQTLSSRIQNAYRTACGDSKYDYIADVNKDQTVNSLDLGQVRQNERNGQWCQQRLDDITNPCVSTPQPIPTVPPSPSPITSSLGPQCQNLFDKTQRSYRTTCGDANYDKLADINKDRVVNSLDQGQLRQHQLEESWCGDRLLNDIDPCNVITGESCQNLYIRMRQAYLRSCEVNGYDPVADVNKDAVVDLFDFSEIRNNISNEGWCNERLADVSSPCIIDSSSRSQTSRDNLIQQIWQGITDLLR